MNVEDEIGDGRERKMRGHSGKNISRRMRRKMAGDMCRRLRRNLSGAANSSFYPRRSRSSTTPVSRMQGDPAGSCASGNAFRELRNIPGRANRSMR